MAGSDTDVLPRLALSLRQGTRLITLAVLMAGGLLAVGCERRAPTAPVEETRSGAPQQVSWDVRFLVSNGAHPRAEIVAGYMAQYERGDSTFTELAPRPPSDSVASDSVASGRVTAYLFDEAGDSSAVITSDEMTYFDEERRFEARGRVVVDTKEGKHLESEHLAWDEAERRVRTPSFVRIITPTDRVQGYGLDADENLANYTLDDVRGETTLDS